MSWSCYLFAHDQSFLLPATIAHEITHKMAAHPTMPVSSQNLATAMDMVLS